jgi:hypothetical protein
MIFNPLIDRLIVLLEDEKQLQLEPVFVNNNNQNNAEDLLANNF